MNEYMCPKCSEAYMYCACKDNPLNGKPGDDRDIAREVYRLRAAQIKIRDNLTRVLDNLRRRKGTPDEGRLAISDYAALRMATKLANGEDTTP